MGQASCAATAEPAGYGPDAPHFWLASQLTERPLGCAGRLARAYLAGYDCSDESELQQLCGGQL